MRKRRAALIIACVRRESSTVVSMAGEFTDGLLAELARSGNVSVVRPPADATAPLVAASEALRQASRPMPGFVLVAADPLGPVASAWQAMWDIRAQGGAADFERQAAEALAAWQAGKFELPDYYLVLTPPDGEQTAADANQGFYLGPLRAARPHRVAAVVTAETGQEAARVRGELRSLRHGPWWPPLAEVLDTARRFNPAAVAEGKNSLAAPAG